MHNDCGEKTPNPSLVTSVAGVPSVTTVEKRASIWDISGDTEC